VELLELKVFGWKKYGTELVFLDLELCQTDTNVIYHSCQLDASIQA
jgi:hypothetical protein